MQRSTPRILTTHTGSLPRPRELTRLTSCAPVAKRSMRPKSIARAAKRCGRSCAKQVLAGTDCGFDTSAGWGRVADDVVWAKLASLRDGARLASDRLF
jgi:methionine synthase II (cobalamin-independent)